MKQSKLNNAPYITFMWFDKCRKVSDSFPIHFDIDTANICVHDCNELSHYGREYGKNHYVTNIISVNDYNKKNILSTGDKYHNKMNKIINDEYASKVKSCNNIINVHIFRMYKHIGKVSNDTDTLYYR
jgi:hypothetical protein